MFLEENWPVQDQALQIHIFSFKNSYIKKQKRYIIEASNQVENKYVFKKEISLYEQF